jgi:hypothetical protein
LITFVGSLVLMPLIVARLPTDYFHHRRRTPRFARNRHPAVHVTLVASKNLIGVLLILGGLAMLVLPGQGVLTILIGIALTNFPGKYRLEKAIVRQPSVFRSLNWIRRKMHKPPLLPPDHED